MTIRYENIIKVNLFHEYYDNNLCKDFCIYPTEVTSQMLNSLQWLYKLTNTGFNIYARVKPNTDPPQLYNIKAMPSTKFTFYLSLINPAFINFTALPINKFDGEILYFSNLRNEQVESKKLLGDQIENVHIGAPIKLITNDQVNYEFNTPVNSAKLIVTDIFDKRYTFEGQNFTLPKPDDKISVYPIDINTFASFPIGRYKIIDNQEIIDNQGWSHSYYYDPSLYDKKVFAIIEIFNDTNDFTSPSVDHVPTDYQFIKNGKITKKGDYAIQFTSKAVDWKYIIRKKPNTSNKICLEKLSLTGEVGFSEPNLIDSKAIFRSANPVLLRESGYSISLKHNDILLFKLPYPAQDLLLQKDADGIFYEMNLYV